MIEVGLNWLKQDRNSINRERIVCNMDAVFLVSFFYYVANNNTDVACKMVGIQRLYIFPF